MNEPPLLTITQPSRPFPTSASVLGDPVKHQLGCDIHYGGLCFSIRDLIKLDKIIGTIKPAGGLKKQ